jgi:hypothetical protein
MALVIISGALANKPRNGGNAWSRLSWVLGFKRLGFEVCFIEQLGRDGCVDAAGAPSEFDRSANLAFFDEVMAQFGLSQSSSLIYRDGEAVHGLPMARLAAMAGQACLLFNMSGHLTLPQIKQPVRCKLYYDDDPGFTQFWHATNNPGARLWDHDFFYTIGENIGRPDCCIPTGEVPWRHTRPPVLLDQWPVVSQPALDRFTTVSSWRGPYGPVLHNGKAYGLKVHEFRKILEAPRQSGQAFEIALQIHTADQKDLEALLAAGWRITDPKKVADSPNAFRRFVQTSGAEFSVAQGIYVETRSGWISDRTVRYLATGKPALVQDTGFSRNYPTGEGLVPFHDLAGVVEGARRIAADYARHCLAARRLAEEYFDSDKVVRQLAHEIGLKLP